MEKFFLKELKILMKKLNNLSVLTEVLKKNAQTVDKLQFFQNILKHLKNVKNAELFSQNSDPMMGLHIVLF